MIPITDQLSLQDWEVQLTAIRAQGAGGQNVNKVASAIHLRFDVSSSTLPPIYKERLLKLKDSRISKEGVVIIKAQRFRTQEKNRDDAIERLAELIREVTWVRKVRRPTKPSKSAVKRRLNEKKQRGDIKKLRGKPL